jgi:hypothetical protein
MLQREKETEQSGKSEVELRKTLVEGRDQEGDVPIFNHAISCKCKKRGNYQTTVYDQGLKAVFMFNLHKRAAP